MSKRFTRRFPDRSCAVATAEERLDRKIRDHAQFTTEVEFEENRLGRELGMDEKIRLADLLVATQPSR